MAYICCYKIVKIMVEAIIVGIFCFIIAVIWKWLTGNDV